MKMLRSRSAASIAALAALSMTATPVLAHGHGGWGRHYHRHGDGGDILAGLLIVGGIAAIASAASKSARDDRADERGRYPGGPDYGSPEDQGYGDAPNRDDDDDAAQDHGSAYPGAAAMDGSFDSAVDHCADELERGERKIGSIDNVGREGDRYSVERRLEDGREFSCSVDRDGQVRSVAVDGHAVI